MTYWVKRIVLKSGEIVTEHEFRRDTTIFEGPAPVVGDTLTVASRGRSFDAKVVWGNWPGREQDNQENRIVSLRISER